MVLVDVDDGRIQADSQSSLVRLVSGWQSLGPVLCSSDESCELLQWLCHDNSTTNIIVVVAVAVGGGGGGGITITPYQ